LILDHISKTQSRFSESNVKRALRMAAARFDASYGKTQVLFFKIKKADASFDARNMSFLANSELLEEMNVQLRVKLRDHARRFIQEMDIGL